MRSIAVGRWRLGGRHRQASRRDRRTETSAARPTRGRGRDWKMKLALGILLVGVVCPVLGPWLRTVSVGGGLAV